jgi:hypothetical protein
MLAPTMTVVANKPNRALRIFATLLEVLEAAAAEEPEAAALAVPKSQHKDENHVSTFHIPVLLLFSAFAASFAVLMEVQALVSVIFASKLVNLTEASEAFA